MCRTYTNTCPASQGCGGRDSSPGECRGIQGIRTNGLPRHILARIFHDRIGPMEMELAAYERGSYELLLQMVLMDPFTKSIHQAKALLDGILALPYHEEMRQHYK